MTDTFNYALVQNAEGNFVIQSTIKSFNLDQVTQKDIVSRPSRSYWTDFEDVLSYNLQPPLYNPELFDPFYIGKDLISKEDEFSSPSLNISNFK